MNRQYLQRLETVLDLYACPHDPPFPVVCFDEGPCFLLGNASSGSLFHHNALHYRSLARYVHP